MKLREFTGWKTDLDYMQWSGDNWWKIRNRREEITLPSGVVVDYARAMELKTAYERYYFKTQTGSIPRNVGCNHRQGMTKLEAIETLLDTDQVVYGANGDQYTGIQQIFQSQETQFFTK